MARDCGRERERGAGHAPQMTDVRACRRLLAAIVLQALADKDTPEYRAEVRRFFRGKWYATVAAYLGLPANVDPMTLDTRDLYGYRVRRR